MQHSQAFYSGTLLVIYNFNYNIWWTIHVTIFTIFTAITRFKIMKPSGPGDVNWIKEMRKFHEDEDGDLSPPRKNEAQDDCDVITIGTGILVLCYFLCVLVLLYLSILHHLQRCQPLEMQNLEICSISPPLLFNPPTQYSQKSDPHPKKNQPH